MITVAPYEQGCAEALCAFHAASYGASSYQANPDYLRWLYHENPAGADVPKGWIARGDDGGIVGCVHLMYLRGGSGGQPLHVHSLQNLVVDEKLRAGVGMLLVKRALRGADIAIFPGVAAALADVYRAIRYDEVPTFWGRRILRPVATALGMALGRLEVERKLPREVTRRLRTGADVPAGQIELLARRMNERPGALIGWSPELIEWRFFSKRGPRHLLYLDEAGAGGHCIVSVGIRRNARVARLIDFGDDLPFLRSVLRDLRSCGMEVVLAFAASDADRRTLTSLGLNALPASPTSFLKRSSRAGEIGGFRLCSAVTDIGFEGIGSAA